MGVFKKTKPADLDFSRIWCICSIASEYIPKYLSYDGSSESCDDSVFLLGFKGKQKEYLQELNEDRYVRRRVPKSSEQKK